MTYQTDVDLVPRNRKGSVVRGDTVEARWQRVLAPLVNAVLEVTADMDFRSSARGLCYMLEGPGLSKGDFDKVEKGILNARFYGFLPVDIVADDSTRAPTDCGVAIHGSQLEEMEYWLQYAAENYRGVSTLDVYPTNVMIVVEKLDLVGLFQPVADEYGVPIYCGRGQPDVNTRIDILKRASHALIQYGKPTTILMFGDHDVGGFTITDGFQRTLERWHPRSGTSSAVLDEITVVRAGLNVEDIEDLGLTWIDGMGTGSGGDLGDPAHEQHNERRVQDYLAKYGNRKVEANALMADIEGARELFRRVLRSMIPNSAVAEYNRKIATGRKSMQKKATELIRLAGDL